MVQQWIEKADVLIEALPYMRRFYGCTLVIKYGGHAMVAEDLRASFATDVVLLKYIGLRPLVVHGGGPQIRRELERRKIAERFVAGLRVTDDATMEVVEAVLGGRINGEIVERIAQSGGRATGLLGSEGGLLEVRCQKPELGRVGEVVAVNTALLRSELDAGAIPIIAPLGADASGVVHNVNADAAAGAIAAALEAEKLILLTDVEGVRDAAGALASQLGEAEIRELIKRGAIAGGMIPKVECCLQALHAGVSRVHIIDGRVLHAVLLEIFTDSGVGTLIET